MPTVEEAYHEAWGKVGGVGRLRRSFALHSEIRRMVEHQIRSKQPGLSERDVAVQVSRRMYLSDAAAQRLLDGAGGKIVWPVQDLQDTMERISAILGDLGLKYHFTGGVASSYYGEPRLTQDLDVVIQLVVDQPETRAFLDRLSTGYLVNEPVALDAIKRNEKFQAIDQQSMIKIDFHVGEKIPGELERGTVREILPGMVGRLVCKEDAILSKLLWLQQGSGKARQDVKAMLMRDEDLDRECLRERAATLGLHDILMEIERET
jgi:hypothetical protein